MENQFFCDVCQVFLNSKIQNDNHMNGKKHFRAIANNAMEISFGPDIMVFSKTEFLCTVCGVYLNGTVPVVDHLRGISHFNKKQRQNNIIVFDDHIELRNNKYFCKLCNISCTGDISMNSHIQGALHVKTLARSNYRTHTDV